MTSLTIDELLLGNSDAIRRVRDLIQRIAPTGLSILLQGPTGSGKELAARAIHIASKRSGDLVALNIRAIADTMFEDALFGHVKGAFTGAVGESAGYLAEANGGTLFLDEISGLEMSAQAKLLRAIEIGVFRPVGAKMDRRSEFRVICASNDVLEQEARRGRFRMDLLQRMSGAVIPMPPLTARPDDIPLLAQHFLSNTKRAQAIPRVTDGALRLLQEHSWPGNIRELQQVLERAAAFATTPYLGSHDIEDALRSGYYSSAPTADSLERQRLLTVLEESRWDTKSAADTLEMHRGTLYRHIKRLGIMMPTRPLGEGVDGASRPFSS
jgi:DNA-binding NtrC family response regulator